MFVIGSVWSRLTWAAPVWTLDVDNILSPFFRGDTLFFVARRVGQADRLRSVLYSFRVDDGGCEWLSTAGPSR